MWRRLAAASFPQQGLHAYLRSSFTQPKLPPPLRSPAKGNLSVSSSQYLREWRAPLPPTATSATKHFQNLQKQTPTHVIKNLNTPKNGASGPKMAAFSSENCGKVLTFFLPATQTNPEPFQGRSPLSLQRLPSHSPSHTSLCTWEKVVGLFASWIALPAAPAATEAKGIV